MTKNPKPPPIDESPEAWVERYGDPLFRVALARVGDRSVTEDLVQETFLAAWNGRESFDGRSSLGTWLVAILKRKIVDHYRKSGRRPQEEAREDWSEAQELFDQRGVWRRKIGEVVSPMETAAERDEFWGVLEACVGELPPTLAQAFSQRELQSASPGHVCERLGITRKNLSVRLHRARLLLRRCLEVRWLGDSGSRS